MPLTAADRIILIRVKIERARKHLRSVAEDLLTARNVTIPVSRDRPGFSQGLPDVITLPRLPFDVVASAGDVVHNLRTALDHLAYQLVVVGSGSEPSRRIEFPIAKDKQTYESEKAKKVQGMRPIAVRHIDNLTPYKGGNERLWQIHELDNIDKHRTLFSVAQDYLFFGEWFDGDYWCKTDEPHFGGVFDVSVETALQEDIARTIGQNNALLPSLVRLVDYVQEVVLSFRRLLE